MWKKTFITVLIATSAIAQEATSESPPSGAEPSRLIAEAAAPDAGAPTTEPPPASANVGGAMGEPTVAPYNIWSVVSGKITSVERGVLP